MDSHVAMDKVELIPIGTVVGGRTEPFDDHWGHEEATIVLDRRVVPLDATRGVDAFSHIEVIYLFHLVDPTTVTSGARRPRGRQDWPEVGILAQRAKGRPNRLGVSTCRLLGVNGLELKVRGLDAIDGTPVLDIKPYMHEFGPLGPVHQPVWATELMADYWE